MIAAVIILSALLVLSILLNPLLLALLLRPALLCVDGKSTNLAHIAAALLGWVADVLGAATWWSAFAGPRHPGERTISDTLERLAHPFNSFDPDYALYLQIARKINRVAQGPHIKVVEHG